MADPVLLKKLGLKAGQRAIILNLPADYRERFEPLPDGVETADRLEGPLDFILLFVKNQVELAERLSLALQMVRPEGALWVAYPKKGSKIPTDISRDVGWGMMNENSYRPVTLISIDETWSCLRFRPLHLVKSSRS